MVLSSGDEGSAADDDANGVNELPARITIAIMRHRMVRINASKGNSL